MSSDLEKTSPPTYSKEFTDHAKLIQDTIGKLQEHPAFGHTTIKNFSPRPTNNLVFHAVYPDSNQKIVKVLLQRPIKTEAGTAGRASELATPHQRLINTVISTHLADLFRIPHPDIKTIGKHNDSYLHKDIPGVITSKFEPNLEHLVSQPNSYEFLNKLDQNALLKHHLFERLLLEDQHAGNVSFKDGIPILIDNEYIFNPLKPPMLAAHIGNSAIGHYFKTNSTDTPLNPKLLDFFTSRKNKARNILETLLPLAYNKEESSAITKHLLDSIDLYGKQKTIKELIRNHDSDILKIGETPLTALHALLHRSSPTSVKTIKLIK